MKPIDGGNMEADPAPADAAVGQQNIGRQILAAFRMDVGEKTGRQKAVAIADAIGLAAVSAIGFSRLPTAQALVISTGVYEATGAPPLPGLLTGLLYGAWCYADARVFDNGMSHLPRVTNTVGRRLPLESFHEFLPGLRPETRQSATTRLARAITIQGPGIASYMVTANLDEQTLPERRRLSRNLALDGALFMGTLATTLTTALYLVGKQDPQIANKIMSIADNKPLVFGLVWGIPTAKLLVKKAGSFLGAAVHRYRERKSAKADGLQLLAALEDDNSP